MVNNLLSRKAILFAIREAQTTPYKVQIHLQKSEPAKTKMEE
jgi:hypothetical protein